MSRPERLRLLDILDAMDRIASYVEGMDYAAFLADRKTQTPWPATSRSWARPPAHYPRNSQSDMPVYPGARSSGCET